MTTKATIRLKEKGGTVWEFHAEELEIGSSKGCDVPFDSELYPSVSGRHATLTVECGLYVLYDNQSSQGTFVNGRRVSLAKLQNGDVVELGRGGPRLVFEGERPLASGLGFLVGQCQINARMLQAMVRDSLEEVAANAANEAKGPGLVQTILERAKLQHSLRLLSGTLLGFLLLALSVGGVFWWAGGSLRALEERTSQREANLERALEDYRQDFSAVAERNQKAVVLIRHVYRVVNPRTGRPIRIIGRRSDGSPLFTESSEGVLATRMVQGTGFVIDRQGTILTNRHVAEPWRQDEELLSRGWSGESHLLTLIFADTEQALPARVLEVSQEVDAAALRVQPFPGMPVVQGIEPDPEKLRQGQQIAIIGFPGGVEMEGRTITSLTTGVLSKVSLEKGLQFDAAVNPGNSGGPIFNDHGEVIGLVYGVGVDPEGERLHGVYYGVPIRFAAALAGD